VFFQKRSKERAVGYAPAGSDLVLHFDGAQSSVDLELEFVACSRRSAAVQRRDGDAVRTLQIHQPARYRTAHWKRLRHRLTARTSVPTQGTPSQQPLEPQQQQHE